MTNISKPALEWLLKHRAAKGKEDKNRLAERRGFSSLPRPASPLLWLHAASVGEAQSALILLEKMNDVNFVVTTGTVTSAALMQKRLPPNAFHQFAPLDHPAWVAAFLNHWKPELALWMESELWPNILMALKSRNVPALLVNARLSDKSFRGWSYAPAFARTLMNCFSLILAQTDQDTKRFQKLGAGNVVTTGNLKYGAAPLPCDAQSLIPLKNSVGTRPTWVYASTHAGEEELAVRLHKKLRRTLPNLLTMIVPRHPERREEILKICGLENVNAVLRSVNKALPNSKTEIYIADTMGELGLFYTLSPIAMIGRSFSLDGGGGHNPFEAAQMGCAVLTGPNNQFQMEFYGDMRRENAVIETTSEGGLYTALLDLFTNPQKLETMRQKSRDFSMHKTDVTGIVLSHLLPYIHKMGGRDAA